MPRLTSHRLVLLWILGAGLSFAQFEIDANIDQPYELLSECSSCAIYILDLASFAHTHGYPVCDLNKVVVDPTTGVVYLREKDTGIAQKVSHKYGTHSAPWYLYQAIKESECHVDDIAEANVVFVYDYCYYIWWLAHIHSALGEKVHDTPGDYLIKGWTALLQLPRWHYSNGRDFVFYDAHPGFAQGKSAPTFLGMFCNEFRHATHVVVEGAQRNVCRSFLEIRKLLITPYVPNVANASDPTAVIERPSPPRSVRNITAYFRGKCTPQTERYIGKKMRHALVKALSNTSSDVDVECSETELGGSHESYQVAFSKMEHSLFCLVLPGDAQSTRRLTEIFLAGCIPVFLGPPYNTMPFANDVDYASIGVYFNITDHSAWLDKEMHWVRHATERALHGQEAQYWIPDANISHVTIPVPSFEEFMGHLREMPQREITRKLAELNTTRHSFFFQEKMSDRPNALNIIIKRICQIFRHRQIPNQRHHARLRLDDDDDYLLAPSQRAEEEGPASSKIGNAWLRLTYKSTAPSEEIREVDPADSYMTGAIRTRGNTWHPFSFKGGLLDIGNVAEPAEATLSGTIPDLDLD